MAQFYGTEDIKDLTKASQTTIDWTAGSYLRIGGQAYNVTSVLTLDLASDIDTGTVSSDTIYYIYAVVVAGIVSLKYSLSDTAPTGFAAFRKISAFQTDGSAEVLAIPKKDEGRVGDIIQSMLSEAQFLEQNGVGWVLADGRSVSGSKYNTTTGNVSIPDMRGQFLRGKNNSRLDGQENPDGDVALGTQQSDEQKEHRHFIHDDAVGTTTPTNTTDPMGSGVSGLYAGRRVPGGTAVHAPSSYVGDNETRGKNVTVNYFIKIEDIAV